MGLVRCLSLGQIAKTMEVVKSNRSSCQVRHADRGRSVDYV